MDPEKQNQPLHNKNKTILVIDDDEKTRSEYATILKKHLFKVFVAKRPQESLDILKNEIIHLLILDYDPKDKNTQKILSKVIKKHPELPILVNSRKSSLEDAIEALRKGAWDYLLKPIAHDTVLIHAVENALEKAFLKKENVDYQNYLEKLVAKRTEELLKAKEKAEESDRLKSTFLTNISHEIKTPMNGILGFADLLKTPSLPENLREDYLNIIEKSGHRMLSIINDIIDISKLEAGEVTFQWEDLNGADIAKLIEDQLKFFLPEAKSKKLKLKTETTLFPDNLSVRVDIIKIAQILTNLIKNAIKFTDKGSITLGYKVENHFVKFSITDTGIGIPDTMKDDIFNRFTQVENALTRHYDGTGLGLSISKAYVDLHGGKIWHETNISGGSSFYFTIPLQKKSQKRQHILSRHKKQHFDIPKGLTILIGEDDPYNYLLLENILKQYKAKVLHAKNGREIISKVKEHKKIDLIIMDLKMPSLSGLEAAKALKTISPDIPIIAQTASAASNIRKLAEESGCNDFISKPIHIETLLTLIYKNVCQLQ